MPASADVVVIAVRGAVAAVCWRVLLPFVRGAARASSSASDLPPPAAGPRRLPPSAPWKVSLLFSLALEEPAAMFVLVVADAALGPAARPRLRPLWYAACFATALLHALFIPFILCGLGTGLWNGRITSKVAWAATLVPFLLWTALFFAIPVPSDVPTTVMAPALLRLCTVGTILLGLLSGSAAAAAASDAWADAELWAPAWLAPYLGLTATPSSDDYIPLASTSAEASRASPHSSALAAADAAVARTRDDAASKRLALAALEQGDHGKDQGWAGWVPSGLRSLPGGKDAALLRSELESLERITLSLERDRSLLAAAHARSQRAKSLMGRTTLALDALVGLYGALVILTTSFSLLLSLVLPRSWRPNKSGNATEHASGILLSILRLLHVPTAQLDPALLTHVTSLLVAGILISLRLRTVIGGLLRLGKYVSSSSQASSAAADGLALFLAQAGAAYLLAALLQLRTVLLPHHHPDTSASSVPPGSLAGRTPAPVPGAAAGADPGPALLASLPPFEDAFGTLFDAAFLFAAVAAVAVAWLRRRAQARAF